MNFYTKIQQAFQDTLNSAKSWFSLNGMTPSIYSISKETAKFKNKLNAPEILPTKGEATTIFPKRVRLSAKQKSQQGLAETWENKAVHGKYPKMTKEADVD